MAYMTYFKDDEHQGSNHLDWYCKNRYELPKHKTLLIRNIEMMLIENLYLTDEELKIYQNRIAPKLLSMFHSEHIFSDEFNNELEKRYIEDSISVRKIKMKRKPSWKNNEKKQCVWIHS